MRRIPLLFVLAAVLVAPGCGGGGEGGGEGAGIAPADVAFYAAFDTDFDSDEWNDAQRLAGKFPDGDDLGRRLLAEIDEDTEGDLDFERDVEPALGPESHLACYSWDEQSDDCVFWTKPDDEAKLKALLERSDEPSVTRKIDDWTLVAESEEVLDRFVKGRDKATLDDANEFKEAMEGVSEEALVRIYVSGETVTREAREDPEIDMRALEAFLPGGKIPSFGLAVDAEEEGGRFEAAYDAGQQAPNGYEAKFPSQLPAGALAYVSFNNLAEGIRDSLRAAGEADEDFDRQLAQAELALGVSIEEDLLPLLEKEGAFAVYPGAESQLAANQPAGLPTMTLLLEVENEEEAVETLDKLARRAQAFADEVDVTETDVDGITAKQVSLGDQGSVLYAAFDGKLVVTTTEEGILGLREEGDRLSDDPVFERAREATEMPDETIGFAYLNLKEGIPFLRELTEASQGEQIPPDVDENLDPLQSLLFFGTSEDDRVTVAGFLGVD